MLSIISLYTNFCKFVSLIISAIFFLSKECNHLTKDSNAILRFSARYLNPRRFAALLFDIPIAEQYAATISLHPYLANIGNDHIDQEYSIFLNLKNSITAHKTHGA